MTEATEGPSAPAENPPADAPTTEAAAGAASSEMEAASEPYEPTPLTIRSMIEAGCHFGHQTRRLGRIARQWTCLFTHD